MQYCILFHHPQSGAAAIPQEIPPRRDSAFCPASHSWYLTAAQRRLEVRPADGIRTRIEIRLHRQSQINGRTRPMVGSGAGGVKLEWMKIGFRLIAGMCAWLVRGSAVLVAQVRPDMPTKTTVCELLKHPDRFDGKLVNVRATIRLGFEFSALFDQDCE